MSNPGNKTFKLFEFTEWLDKEARAISYLDDIEGALRKCGAPDSYVEAFKTNKAECGGSHRRTRWYPEEIAQFLKSILAETEKSDPAVEGGDQTDKPQANVTEDAKDVDTATPCSETKEQYKAPDNKITVSEFDYFKLIAKCDSLAKQVADKEAELIELQAANSDLQTTIRGFYTNTEHGVTMQDRHFRVDGDCGIADENFDHDAGLRISRDFAEGDRLKYTQMICAVLNSHEKLKEALQMEQALNLRYASALEKVMEFPYCEITQEALEVSSDKEAIREFALNVARSIAETVGFKTSGISIENLIEDLIKAYPTK